MSSPSNVNGPQGQDPWSNYGFGEDGEIIYGDEGWGPEEDSGVPGDQYVGPEGEPGGTPLPVKETLDHLRELLGQIRSDSTIDPAIKGELITKINKLIPKLQTLLNQHVEVVPGEIAQQVSDVELTAHPAPAEGLAGEEGVTGEEGAASDKETLKTQIADLEKEIDNNANLSDSTKTEMKSKLDRAKSALDLKSTDISQAQQIYDEVFQDFQTRSTIPKGANDLATLLNKTPEDVMSAAQEAGVNLDSLPNPPDEKVMKMLNALGVPSEEKIGEFNTVKEQREADMKSLKDKLKGQDDHWHQETEDAPSQSDFKTSFNYYNRKDDKYQQLVGLETEMQGDIVGALNAMGYSAAAGPSPDQVTVGGTNLDFFNEETGTMGFNTTLTDLAKIQDNEDFYPAPRNTESGDEGHIQDMSEEPEGYPEITYTVD